MCHPLQFPKLKVYAPYCGNIRRAIGLLARRAESDSHFQRLAQEAGLGVQDAISFSFKPMQRIVKLELMVKALKDLAAEGAAEKWDLQNALALIEDVCMHLNHVKCAIDDYTKLKEIKVSAGFDLDFMSPSQRRLVFAGSVTSITEDGERQNLMALLFSDFLVLMNEDGNRKKRERKNSFLSRVSMIQKSNSKTKTRFTLFYQPISLTFLKVTDGGKARFSIEDLLHSVEFEMEAPSAAMKVEWMRHLQERKETFAAGSVLKSTQFPRIASSGKILCSTAFQNTFFFGTDKGLARVREEGDWEYLKGSKKVLQVKASASQKLILMLVKGFPPLLFTLSFISEVPNIISQTSTFRGIESALGHLAKDLLYLRP